MPTHEGKCDLCRIEMDNVNVRRGHSVLLRDINLHIHCGELTALIGPNGAGKTTLLKALMGIIPHDGNIAHFKHDGSTLSQVRVGYVPQRLDMDVDTPVSVMDLVQSAIGGRPSWLGSSREDKERARNLLSVTHVEGLINRRVGALSGGELQRVLLALALDPMPDLLILDEPISGMDQNGVDMFYNMVENLLRERHMAILLVSHDFDMVRRHAQRAILIKGTVLCDGTPDDVFASPEFISVFGRIGGGAA